MAISFDAWLEAVFDHPVSSPEWYWADQFDDEWESYGLDDAVIVSYLARLFRGSSGLATYSLDQVAIGIWFLMGDLTSAQVARSLLAPHVPLHARVDAVAAMADFFRDFVAPAAPGPADTDTNAFHIACYMWWDIFPSWGGERSGEPAFHDACLDVMADVLKLRSELCQISALHGLNHWHLHHAERVERTIDAFLAEGKDVSGRIREYAATARRGMAL